MLWSRSRGVNQDVNCASPLSSTFYHSWEGRAPISKFKGLRFAVLVSLNTRCNATSCILHLASLWSERRRWSGVPLVIAITRRRIKSDDGDGIQRRGKRTGNIFEDCSIPRKWLVRVLDNTQRDRCGPANLSSTIETVKATLHGWRIV